MTPEERECDNLPHFQGLEPLIRAGKSRGFAYWMWIITLGRLPEKGPVLSSGSRRSRWRIRRGFERQEKAVEFGIPTEPPANRELTFI
jgi:hypothetical protein